MVFYYDSTHHEAPIEMSLQLANFLSEETIGNRPVIVLCIGSDRSTGDSLGPLVGYKLTKCDLNSAIVLGTLNSPVHAANLQETIDNIYQDYDNPYIIAIDASLGKKDHIGCITLGTGALRPGLGVKKELPEIGDIYITGIVNFSGMMDTILLQTTRLSTIMNLADAIADAIVGAFEQICIPAAC